jgi:hypothetical protein
MLFADAALACRIEAAECRLSLAIKEVSAARGGDTFSLPVGGGAAVFTGAGSPINKVIGVGFAGPAADAEWDTVERLFAEKHCLVRVEVSTLADLSFAAGLTRRGYVLSEFEDVLGFDLTPAGLMWPEPVEGLTITPDERDLATWINAVVEGFAHPDGSPQSSESVTDEGLKEVMESLALSAGFIRYLARVQGTIAGGAGLRVSDGIAQFCGASTIPYFRRRGVQSALLRRRLADAREAGCELAIVTAAPGSKSHSNVQRQGFHLLYSRAVLVKD